MNYIFGKKFLPNTATFQVLCLIDAVFKGLFNHGNAFYLGKDGFAYAQFEGIDRLACDSRQ
ncbi:hypothetical protein BRW83_2233 [Oxalobacter formigenes]|nr:hypothetical protein BRW83_2233 [Oxalobacter formigenes]